MMFELVVNFRKDLEKSIKDQTLKTGGTRYSKLEDQHYDLGIARGLEIAHDMYLEYLRKVIDEDDE